MFYVFFAIVMAHVLRPTLKGDAQVACCPFPGAFGRAEVAVPFGAALVAHTFEHKE